VKKLIIEARINEYEMRDANPHVPWTPEEIAADAARCREAGAAIVHFHARKPDGAPDFSAQTYGEIIRRIKERSDILVHPTLGAGRADQPVSQRIKPVMELGADASTRPDLIPLCMGSPNWDFFDGETGRFVSSDKIFVNKTEDLIASARGLTAAGFGLSCVCWEVGATRRLSAFLDAGIVPAPGYLVFHLTSGGMLAGHPGTPEGLDVHLAFLPEGRAVEWAVINLHGSMIGLLEMIIRRGGHVQIGIGDYPYRENGAPTNAELVRQVAETAAQLGREVATPEEAAAILGLKRGSTAKPSP
jgi:uncharacterized protein (DUF849 family)